MNAFCYAYTPIEIFKIIVFMIFYNNFIFNIHIFILFYAVVYIYCVVSWCTRILIFSKIPYPCTLLMSYQILVSISMHHSSLMMFVLPQNVHRSLLPKHTMKKGEKKGLYFPSSRCAWFWLSSLFFYDWF